jgi:DNA-binding NtrC family response regulator
MASSGFSDHSSTYLTKSAFSFEVAQTPARPTILLATVDLEIRNNMTKLLEPYGVKAVWAQGMEQVKSALSKGTVAACFCGFWLVDGTYRDVVRYFKRQPTETPVIIVCAPSCPREWRGYLAALNIRAFDYICYPYPQTDFERVLRSVLARRDLTVQVPSSLPESPNDSRRSSGLRRAS